jgi:phenylpyruvate tautomerase PptA (4-oxalocrotonate tautomerase family)
MKELKKKQEEKRKKDLVSEISEDILTHLQKPKS